MARVRVNMHRAAMQSQLERASLRWGDRVGRAVVNEMRRRCPVDEGALRASHDHVVIPRPHGVRVVIGSPLPYAEYVNRGTGIYGPHGTPIVPVTAKALKFRVRAKDARGRPRTSKDKGNWVFAKSVQGQEANPYMAESLEAVLGGIVRRH